MQKSKAAFLYLKQKLSRKEDERSASGPSDAFMTDLYVTTYVQPFRIRWVLDRFHCVNGYSTPEFQPSPRERFTILVEQRAEDFFLSLVYITDLAVNVSYHVTVSDTKGRKLRSQKGFTHFRSVAQGPENVSRHAMLRIPKPTQSTLIVDCTLKTDGCVSTYCRKSDSQQCKFTCLQDFSSLFTNRIHTDVEFRVCGDLISAHKAILSARSPCFKVMFESGMVECGSNEIKVDDIQPDFFNKLLEFLYTGGVIFNEKPSNVKEVYDLYYAADKYHVADLRRMCCDMMCSMVTDDDVLDVLTWSDKHSDRELKMYAIHFVVSHFDTISNTEQWKTFVVNEEVLSAEVQKRLAG